MSDWLWVCEITFCLSNFASRVWAGNCYRHEVTTFYSRVLLVRGPKRGHAESSRHSFSSAHSAMGSEGIIDLRSLIGPFLQAKLVYGAVIRYCENRWCTIIYLDALRCDLGANKGHWVAIAHLALHPTAKSCAYARCGCLPTRGAFQSATTQGSSTSVA